MPVVGLLAGRLFGVTTGRLAACCSRSAPSTSGTRRKAAATRSWCSSRRRAAWSTCGWATGRPAWRDALGMAALVGGGPGEQPDLRLPARRVRPDDAGRRRRPRDLRGWAVWAVALGGGVVLALPWLLAATGIWAVDRVLPGADLGEALRGGTTFTPVGAAVHGVLAALRFQPRSLARRTAPAAIGWPLAARTRRCWRSPARSPRGRCVSALRGLRGRQLARSWSGSWCRWPGWSCSRCATSSRSTCATSRRCCRSLLALLAHGAVRLRRPWNLALGQALLVVFLISLTHYYFDARYAKAEVRGAVAHIAARGERDLPILAPNVGPVVRFYDRGAHEVLGCGNEATLDDAPPQADALVARQLAGRPAAWVVSSHTWYLDPHDLLPAALGAAGHACRAPTRGPAWPSTCGAARRRPRKARERPLVLRQSRRLRRLRRGVSATAIPTADPLDLPRRRSARSTSPARSAACCSCCRCSRSSSCSSSSRRRARSSSASSASGRRGGVFACYKFRSMCGDAEHRKDQLQHLNEATGAAFKIKDDPRITGVGRFLRRSSLDEFPQLLERAARRDVDRRAAAADPQRGRASTRPADALRLLVRPGLTCLWQVSGRSQLDFAEWMALDREYVRRRSLGFDLQDPAAHAARGHRAQGRLLSLRGTGHRHRRRGADRRAAWSATATASCARCFRPGELAVARASGSRRPRTRPWPPAGPPRRPSSRRSAAHGARRASTATSRWCGGADGAPGVAAARDGRGGPRRRAAPRARCVSPEPRAGLRRRHGRAASESRRSRRRRGCLDRGRAPMLRLRCAALRPPIPARWTTR